MSYWMDTKRIARVWLTAWLIIPRHAASVGNALLDAAGVLIGALAALLALLFCVIAPLFFWVAPAVVLLARYLQARRNKAWEGDQ